MTELSPETAAFLAEQRASSGPTLDDRKRIRERLMLELGAAAFSSAAASAAQETLRSDASDGASHAAVASGKISLVVKLALSAAVLGGIALFAAQILQPTPKASVPAKVVEVATLSAPRVAETPSHTVEDAPVEGAAETKAAKKARVRGTNVGHAGSLAEEVALLSRAQTALRSGHAHDALALAREHQRRFPAGAMGHERLGIEAMARCALGEPGGAAASEFLRSAASSPLANSVRKACKLP